LAGWAANPYHYRVLEARETISITGLAGLKIIARRARGRKRVKARQERLSGKGKIRAIRGKFGKLA
jgi:hypothetical protein